MKNAYSCSSGKIFISDILQEFELCGLKVGLLLTLLLWLNPFKPFHSWLDDCTTCECVGLRYEDSAWNLRVETGEVGAEWCPVSWFVWNFGGEFVSFNFDLRSL